LIKCRKTDLGKILWKSRKEGLHLIRLKSPMLGALREEVVPGSLYFIPVTQEVLSGHLLHKCTREKLTVFLEDGQTSDRWTGLVKHAVSFSHRQHLVGGL
jgi:hypothetical protein